MVTSAVQSDAPQPYSQTIENVFKITGLALVVSGIALVVIGSIMHLSLLPAATGALAGGASLIAFGYCVHCCKAAALEEGAPRERVRTGLSLEMSTIKVNQAGDAQQEGIAQLSEDSLTKVEPLQHYFASEAEERSPHPAIEGIVLRGSKNWERDVTRLLRDVLKADGSRMVRLSALSERNKLSELFNYLKKAKNSTVFVIIENIEAIYDQNMRSLLGTPLEKSQALLESLKSFSSFFKGLFGFMSRISFFPGGELLFHFGFYSLVEIFIRGLSHLLSSSFI